MIVYDLETVKAIPDKKSSHRNPKIEYCEGWHDHANMGVSVIGAYDYDEDRYRVFCKDNFGEFRKLAEKTNLLIGFNNILFDNRVLREMGNLFSNAIDINDDKCYDILQEVWEGEGLERIFSYPSHIGYGLDAICSANFGTSKSGHGALAPVLWQEGKIGEVIDYCLNDVKLTKDLLDHIIRFGTIKSPKEKEKVITIRRPGKE